MADAKPQPVWQQVGYTHSADFAQANLWGKISHDWVSQLMELGRAGCLAVQHALPLLSECDIVTNCVRRYDALYNRQHEQEDSREQRLHGHARRNGFQSAILRAQTRAFLMHSGFALIEVTLRVTAPLLLRGLIQWLEDYDSAGAAPEEYLGWAWAIAFGCTGIFMTLVHHQLFWVGMRMGYVMKQQVRTLSAGL